jgi:hypothetical protein
MSTVDDLRALAASSLDSLKRRLDALHGDSVRDLEASHSRISKRIKVKSPIHSFPPSLRQSPPPDRTVLTMRSIAFRSVCAVQMQTQSCLQLAEEAEKEHKKVAEKISESADEMKVRL